MAKRKFKVGDKVKLKKSYSMGWQGICPKGAKGIIERFRGDDEYLARFEGFTGRLIVDDSEIEKRMF